MKPSALIVVFIVLMTGCSRSSQPSPSSASAPAEKPKIYALEDVDKELKDAGVALDADQATVKSFFSSHPAYHVCQDTEGSTIAVTRNKKVDPKADEEYIVIAYRDAKVANLDITPAMFSASDLASYCR